MVANVRTLLALVGVASALGCNTGPREEPKPEPKAPAAPAPSAAVPPTTQVGLRLGAPIESSAQKVLLADVAKNPNAFVGKKFATTGTVTAVCQHKGCWMEIKDEASEAHIKMAGHAFFVPRTANGKKARVLATLVKGGDEPACEAADHDKMATSGGGAGAPGEAKGKGCRAEAEAQLGRPLAKLELVADGVELL
ncbi:MAG: DUF4920 domain-containing protein [Deltaproteobacteria bacterium]|nr:DUF4920 domain-containing protein [Deltaproteobacteria bacterium]